MSATVRNGGHNIHLLFLTHAISNLSSVSMSCRSLRAALFNMPPFPSKADAKIQPFSIPPKYFFKKNFRLLAKHCTPNCCVSKNFHRHPARRPQNTPQPPKNTTFSPSKARKTPRKTQFRNIILKTCALHIRTPPRGTLRPHAPPPPLRHRKTLPRPSGTARPAAAPSFVQYLFSTCSVFVQSYTEQSLNKY